MAPHSTPAVTLSLLFLGSLLCRGYGTYVDMSSGFKVVNDAALNGRGKSGELTRTIVMDEAELWALSFTYAGDPTSVLPPNALYYLSLVTQPTADSTLWNQVWSANRDRPVHEGASLEMDSTGNMVLTDVDGTVVWRTGTAQLNTVAGQLDASGNWQLWNSTNGTIWQSFDSPTDCVLPGQYVRTGKSLVSSMTTNGMDYSKGSYSMQALPGGMALYANYGNAAAKPYFMKSVEANLTNDLDAVLHTCRHPNNVLFDSSYGIVIVTDLTKVSPAAKPSLCGNGDSVNSTAVISMTASSMEGGGTQQFLRMEDDGWLRLYQYDIFSQRFECVGNITATPPK